MGIEGTRISSVRPRVRSTQIAPHGPFQRQVASLWRVGSAYTTRQM